MESKLFITTSPPAPEARNNGFAPCWDFFVPPQKRKKHEIEKSSGVQMHGKKKTWTDSMMSQQYGRDIDVYLASFQEIET